MLAAVEVLEGFEAETYFRALIAVAQTDGVKPEEVDFINHQAEVLGFDEVDFDAKVDLAELGRKASGVTRRLILRDCIVVASTDGVFTDTERARVLEIAHQLQLDATLVEKLERWVQRYSDLLKEGQELIAGGSQ